MPRRTIVDIRRNELHTHRTDVWPWEIPILQLIHKGDVKEVGEHDVENRVPPPDVEYERLSRRYGFDKETHEVRVHAVYGVGPLGVGRLADAMKAHVLEQEEIDKGAAAALEHAAEDPPSDTGEPQPGDHVKDRDAAGEHAEPRSKRRASS